MIWKMGVSLISCRIIKLEPIFSLSLGKNLDQ